MAATTMRYLVWGAGAIGGPWVRPWREPAMT